MTDFNSLPFVTISSRQPADDNGFSSGDSAYGSSLGDSKPPSATHDISRVNYHVKRLPDFAKALEDSAARAFPNRGSSQRYRKVYVLLLHWDSDDLFVLPELEDLEICLQQDYNFETERFTIPSSNAHLDLMLKIGAMIKDHESTDTLLIVYYGGHARIDDARQSTWCASRSPGSPWLQWSAIQTLLERSLSDALILLDCCAGAASAAFPTGNSITETISASSWDAIAPNPGRYSFTSTLLEVLQEWKRKTFSVAMLHAEILARLKHPRPERHNGNRFETRTTPVHFMMTANHKAPSIELCRIPSDIYPPSLPSGSASGRSSFLEGRASTEDIIGSEPNESVPHVMISLALEDDQNLNIDDWERWLATIPALAKYVQVQGVFKSHSTLLLLSVPVMVWDMLPDHHACNFIAFIRSNNLITQKQGLERYNPTTETVPGGESVSDHDSIYSGTTTVTDLPDPPGSMIRPKMDPIQENKDAIKPQWQGIQQDIILATRPPSKSDVQGRPNFVPQSSIKGKSASFGSALKSVSNISESKQSGRVRAPLPVPETKHQAPSRPALPTPAENRLEEYFVNNNPKPTVAVKEFLASSLGLKTADIDSWFRHRREQQEVSNKLQSLHMGDQHHNSIPKDGARMILPGHLNKLLEIFPTGQVVVIDLRPNDSYQRSHIHGAINFRAPASFVSRASMEMIEKALTDEASRSSFDKWYTSQCVVFYDSIVEYPWEAPVAETFFRKFKSKHWTGQCFVLKGHYREFSHSFDKYIVGSNTTDKATEYLASLHDVPWEKSKDDHQRYDDWLKLLDDEDRAHTTEPPPADKSERLQATDRRQQTLEDEFRREFPSLYQQAQTRQPDDNWSVKAPMVAHLERGIAKMQREAALSRPLTIPSSISIDSSSSGVPKIYGKSSTWGAATGPPHYTRYPDELNDPGSKEYGRKEAEDDYYYHQQHLNVWQGAAPPLNKSPSSSTLRGKSSDEPSAGNPNIAAASGMGPAAHDKKGRSPSLFTRIIRSGRPDAPSSR
ncbi:hypothetical protein NUW58_g2778 [Xylaria curta]|uniref:Uncharacterized protein n=2 Tax=Xylaria curta TaxID=42375 RepID=A0ACC1P5B4_9PEZI|nr:hypothetical protein NUW58_g4681 [Xylaria curta]KAJ2990795.1 hypothetical protein NUW58_g2778 [Xylaria curta]